MGLPVRIEILNQLDLTYPQYVVMMALKRSISIAELLEKTAIDGGA